MDKFLINKNIKVNNNQKKNKGFNPNLERIAITCGDAGENHQGMTMEGSLGIEGS